jgi:hypothetical protein
MCVEEDEASPVKGWDVVREEWYMSARWSDLAMRSLLCDPRQDRVDASKSPSRLQ